MSQNTNPAHLVRNVLLSALGATEGRRRSDGLILLRGKMRRLLDRLGDNLDFETARLANAVLLAALYDIYGLSQDLRDKMKVAREHALEVVKQTKPGVAEECDDLPAEDLADQAESV